MSLLPAYFNTLNTKKRKQKRSPGWQQARSQHDAWLMSIGAHPSQRTKPKPKPKTYSNKVLPTTRTDITSFNKCGVKPISNYKLEESKKFVVAIPYNKGGYQVVTKQNIKDIGK